MLGYEVGDEVIKLRGRKSTGRRGKKTMKRRNGKGKENNGCLR